MARKKGKQSADKRRRVLGILLVLAAVLLLTSLVTNHYLDIARITGEMDSHLSPFEIKYHNQAGMLGAYLAYFLTTLLGWLAYFLPLGMVLISIRLLTSQRARLLRINGLLLFAIALTCTLIYNVHWLSTTSINVDSGAVGGYVSEKLTLLSLKFLNAWGSYILLSGLIIILLIWRTSISSLLPDRWLLSDLRWFKTVLAKLFRTLLSILSFRWLRGLFKLIRGQRRLPDLEHSEEISDADDSKLEEDYDEYEENENEPQLVRKPTERRQATIKRAPEQLQLQTVQYSYPTKELLDDNEDQFSSTTPEELNVTAELLKETLESFGITIEGAISKQPGPVITRYEFKPGSGIKVSQINNLADDLALALRAKRIRLIAPIPGKAAVGVEIPNRHPKMVRLKEILESDEFTDPSKHLPLALGKTTSGNPYVTDLAKLPHVLVAGATGAGKSVCLNTIVSSLIYRLHPHQIRFIMIDPKMLELTVYSGIPHLGRPVVTNPRRAEKVLSDAVVEMESRYRKLAAAGVRNIDAYNRKQEDEVSRIPYIVILVDELADLMMSSGSPKIETLITRLAQMSRAVGIHLVLATQRPSVDVITGLIKANFPSRIAFQVSSKVDSRTIIDANGAEKLLGSGDMLFLPSGQPEPIRIHGAYTSNEETDRIVQFIKQQGLEMMALESISQATGEATEADIDFGDPLFKEACEVVLRHKQGSVSLLQRRLGIGYQRAARLIDKLEEASIVSPFDGSKAREVLIDKAYLEDLFTRKSTSATTASE